MLKEWNRSLSEIYWKMIIHIFDLILKRWQKIHFNLHKELNMTLVSSSKQIDIWLE